MGSVGSTGFGLRFQAPGFRFGGFRFTALVEGLGCKSLSNQRTHDSLGLGTKMCHSCVSGSELRAGKQTKSEKLALWRAPVCKRDVAK